MNNSRLRQIKVYLTNLEYQEQFAEVVKECSKRGIECSFFAAHTEEMTPYEKDLPKELQKECLNKEDLNKKNLNKEDLNKKDLNREVLQDHDLQEAGILLVTDDVRCYQRFLSEGLPVLVYLHALNYGTDFSQARYAMEQPRELGAEYFERVWQRFYNLPWRILETERCMLRETIEEDVPGFFEIYKEKEITRYMEDLFPTMEEEREYTTKYRKFVYEFYEHGIWTVLDRETGTIIGRAGIAIREDYEEPEICFMTAVPFQRKGIATEVVRAIMAYGQEYFGYEEYIAFVDPENEVSKHFLVKLGFGYEKEVSLAVIEGDSRREQSFDLYHWKG